jgi:aminotransferase EvaB
LSGDIASVPLNDLSRGIQRDRQALLDALGEVLDSGYVIRGPKHAEFESALAAFIGVEHAIGLASGTDALELAIKASMPTGRTTVLTAANAGGYTSTAARRAGFLVDWADVDPDSLCISAETVAAALTPDVGVVVATHLYGNLTDLTDLVELCHSRGIRVVEDCAQAIGARLGSRAAGSWADVAAISFYPTKNLGALGDGGAVVTDDPDIASSVRQLSQYGWSEKYRVDVSGGVNSRLDEMQAAMLLVRLPMLDELNERRRHIVARYVEATQDADKDLIAVQPAVGERHVAHLAVARSGNRDRVRELLAGVGVKTDVHFPIPDYDQPGFGASGGAPRPVTDLLSTQIFSLPCFPEMTDDEIDFVCLKLSELA